MVGFMHIVHVASELCPVAKVGGLADVLLGLNRELSHQGYDVDIIIPKYDCMNTNEIRDFAIDTQEVLSYYDGKWYSNTIWVGWVENLKVYFIEPHHPKYFFNRSCFYGCDDDTERYLYFSRAALEFLFAKGATPDIIHLHDWQTAAIAPLYKEIFKAKATKPSHIIFTIHNLEYQGKCAPFNLDWIGLPGLELATYAKLQDFLYPTSINLLKGGIVYSDYFTTVSPTYAGEIQTQEGGRGLDQTIRLYLDKFKGILNGVDYTFWNPETDKYLPAHFSPREVPASKKDTITIDAKAYVKKVLRERLFLAEVHRPIVGCIARLVPQKGIEMIKHVIMTIAEKGGQFVLLGSTPIPAINAQFQFLKETFKDHPHIHLTLQHQEELAHLIFAGSDLLIVPSLFEPCGLTQLIGMKYGTIPVVRQTGGLADTVFDVEHSSLPEERRNGFTFEHPNKQGIDSALDRGIQLWYNAPDKWRQLMIRVMRQDFSWSQPSKEYLEVYRSLIGKT